MKLRLQWENRAKETHREKVAARFGLSPEELLETVLRADGLKAWLGPNYAPSNTQGTLALALKVHGRHLLIPVLVPGFTDPRLLQGAVRALKEKGGFVKSVFWAEKPPGFTDWDQWKRLAIKL